MVFGPMNTQLKGSKVYHVSQADVEDLVLTHEDILQVAKDIAQGDNKIENFDSDKCELYQQDLEKGLVVSPNHKVGKSGKAARCTHYVQKPGDPIDPEYIVRMTSDYPEVTQFSVSMGSESSYRRESKVFDYPSHPSVVFLVVKTTSRISSSSRSSGAAIKHDNVLLLGQSNFKKKLGTDYTLRNFDQKNCFISNTHILLSTDRSIRDTEIDKLFAHVISETQLAPDYDQCLSSARTLCARLVEQFKLLTSDQIRNIIRMDPPGDFQNVASASVAVQPQYNAIWPQQQFQPQMQYQQLHPQTNYQQPLNNLPNVEQPFFPMQSQQSMNVMFQQFLLYQQQQQQQQQQQHYQTGPQIQPLLHFQHQNQPGLPPL